MKKRHVRAGPQRADDRVTRETQLPARGTPQAERSLPSLLSLDGIALLAVYMQVTELYRPLGYIFGFPNSLWVNMIFLACFSGYLVARIESVKALPSGIVLAWCSALVGFPLVLMSLQLLDSSVTTNRLVYWTIFASLFMLLLLVTIVLWSRWGPRLTRPFFLAAIAAAWLGFIVNWVDYQFLRDVMAHGSISIWISEHTTRAIGFYQHPNAAAFSLVLYFVCLACNQRFLNGNFVVQTTAAMASLIGVLITGSRTSLLLLAIAFVWYLRNMTKSSADFLFESREATRKRVLLMPLIPIAVSIMSILALQILSVSRRDLAEMVSVRIESLTELGSDVSAGQRITMVSRYFADLFESPLLGRGPDYATQQIAAGDYLNVSQNAWLEWSLAMGIPYALLMGMVLLWTYRYAELNSRTRPLLHAFTSLVIIIFLIISFSMVNPFWLRTPICVLGVLLGLVIYHGNLEDDDANRSPYPHLRDRSVSLHPSSRGRRPADRQRAFSQ